MSEGKIEAKADTNQEKKTIGSETAHLDTGTAQRAEVNRPSSTLSPAELEYALARPA